MENAALRAVPAPASPSAVAGLPVELTRFVGRARELAEVRSLLGQCRLVTLTGAGGSGKTRLAREAVASCVGVCLDGIAWVDLTPLSDPNLVASHVAGALGVREETGLTLVDALIAAFGGRGFLLALDNCEHVVDACAALVDALLRRCPRLGVLTTSREALGIAGERAWLVPPLSLPKCADSDGPEVVARSEAVQLFVERAQEAQPSFRLDAGNSAAVAHVCQRLDGIPLAIELAAARVRVLAPEQIAARLDDAFRLLVASGRTVLPRHRTLRETIEWSHRLLEPAEAVLFRRLSVFAGSFSLEAAEAVCALGCADAGVVADGVLDLLASLVDKSLVGMEVRGGEARYRLLETVRQYAHRHLEEAGESAALQAAHAEWYTSLAEAAEPRIFGGASDLAWLARLEEDEGNLRAALDWSEADPERAELGLRLTAAIHWAWFAWGHFGEGRQRLTRALARGASAPPRPRARAATALGTAALWQGDLAAARAPMEEAVALLRAEGEPASPAEVVDLAYALSGLGAALSMAREPAPAAELLEESHRLAQRLEPCVFTSFVLYWRGVSAVARGDQELARGSLEEALAVGRRLGGGPGLAHPLTLLGHLALFDGRYDAARRYLGECLVLHEAAGDLWGTVQTIEGLAALAIEGGRIDRGARLVGAADTLRRGIGSPLPSPSETACAERMAVARAAFGEALFDRARSDGQALTREERSALAREEAAEGEPLPGPLHFPIVVPAAEPEPVRPCCEGGPTPGGCAPAAAAEAPDLAIRALGPFELVIAGEPSTGRCTGRARELLVLLACHPGGRSKDQVGLALWPESSASQVRNLFHVTLHRLRKVLGRAEWVIADGESYRLAPEVRLELDAERFETEASAALRELRAAAAPAKSAESAESAESADGAAADRLSAALGLYRGDLLEGESAGEWHLDVRSRLEELYLDALRTLGGALDAAGRHAEAADAFRRLLARDDLDEETHRRLLGSLAGAGDRAGLQRAYRRLVDLLRRELDVEPEAETTALYERLRRAR